MGNSSESEGNVETSSKRAEVLWQQYTSMVDLYKFYMNLILKAITWFYAITGAILTYYFAPDHQNGGKWVSQSILLPTVFSFGLGIICLLGVFQAIDLKRVFESINKDLKGEYALVGQPHVIVLVLVLLLSGSSFIAVGIELALLFHHSQAT